MDKNKEIEINIFIAQELEKGTSLSDIQNMVNQKFDEKMTYMDIRILASSLDVDWRALDPNAAKTAEPAKEEELDASEPDQVLQNGVKISDDDAEIDNSSDTGTAVEVSPIARPGMMFSGNVKFASGSSAEWYVDNMGRLGLENLVGEKPTREDVEQFQIELDKAIRKMMGQ